MLPTHLDVIHNEIRTALPTLRHNYYRLALAVGKTASGKTRLLRALAQSAGYPLINVNLQIAERLLEHTIADRPTVTQQLLSDIVKEAHSPIVLLDNMELLFDVTLQLNPLKVIQSISRNYTLVASWNGEYANGVLIYAEPGHPEYRRYTLTPQDALVFQIGNSI